METPVLKLETSLTDCVSGACLHKFQRVLPLEYISTTSAIHNSPSGQYNIFPGLIITWSYLLIAYGCCGKTTKQKMTEQIMK